MLEGEVIPSSPSPACFDLAKRFESLRLEAYLDPVRVWTIGWGHTKNVKQGDTCTEGTAEAWLQSDMQDAASHLNIYAATLTLSQPQYDAVVDSLFNIGPGVPESWTGNVKGRDGIIWLAKRDAQKIPQHSTLFRHLLAGEYQQAADEFPKWVHGTDEHGNVIVLPGLVTRRAAEREMFLSGMMVTT